MNTRKSTSFDWVTSSAIELKTQSPHNRLLENREDNKRNNKKEKLLEWKY